MAKCVRCGAYFNYEKREGVCPKCCFYNRPEGSFQTDNAWTKNYDIDDSGYQLPKMEEENSFDEEKIPGLFGKLKRDRNGNCEQQGSHVHKSFDVHGYDGDRIKQTENKTSSAKNNGGKVNGCLSVAAILVAIYVAASVVLGFLLNL